MLYVLIAILIVGITVFYLALFKAAAKEDKFWEQVHDNIKEE